MIYKSFIYINIAFTALGSFLLNEQEIQSKLSENIIGQWYLDELKVNDLPIDYKRWIYEFDKTNLTIFKVGSNDRYEWSYHQNEDMIILTNLDSKGLSAITMNYFSKDSLEFESISLDGTTTTKLKKVK